MTVYGGRNPKPAIVPFDDRLADREAHSHAVRFGRKQRLENTIRVGRINSHSGIFDRDLHPILSANFTEMILQAVLVLTAVEPLKIDMFNIVRERAAVLAFKLDRIASMTAIGHGRMEVAWSRISTRLIALTASRRKRSSIQGMPITPNPKISRGNIRSRIESGEAGHGQGLWAFTL
jgi:hypothetical protein